MPFLQKNWMRYCNLCRAYGWDAFRDRESEILAECTGYEKCIIATGVALFCVKRTRNTKRAGLTIFLDVSSEIIVERLMANPLHGQRPSLTDSLWDED